MKQFKIGKGANNEVVIENDPTVSRVHLAVFIDDEKNIFITDLGSTNGTFINGVRKEESVKLETLDVLRIGNSLVDWPRFLSDDDDLDKVYETLKDPPSIADESVFTNYKLRKIKPIYKYLFVLFLIVISVLLFMGIADKNGYYDEDSDQTKKTTISIPGIKKQKKQRTNVTYDFSCLNSDGDYGTNKEIYNFGEITRDVQSSFFEDIDISVSDEEEQGQKLLEALKKEYRFIFKGSDYQNLNSILKNLVSRLAKPRGFDYKIYLIDDPELNAFTIGGYIFFYKGMYNFCQTNSEIAAIISHEIAHNELGHSTLAIKKQKAAEDFGVFGEIIKVFDDIIENNFSQSFGQKQESEADLFGMDLVYPTSFKNCHAINFWKRMSQNENEYDMIENFSRSHPYSKNRSLCIDNHLKSNYSKYCY